MLNPAKKEIALEFLEAAIIEREEYGRHFVAMNLAGVAEELFGKMVRISGAKDQRTEAIDVLLELQDKAWPLLGWKKRDRKEMRKLLLTPKNSIKHLDNSSDLNAKLIVPAEKDSKMSIQGAIRNLEKLDIKPSRTVQNFKSKYKNESS